MTSLTALPSAAAIERRSLHPFPLYESITCHGGKTEGSTEECLDRLALRRTMIVDHDAESAYRHEHHEVIHETKANVGKASFEEY